MTYAPKTWITEASPLGPPANPATATPLTGPALTAEFTDAYQGAKDYTDGQIAVVNERLAPTGGDDSSSLQTAVNAVGAGGRVELQPNALFQVSTVITGKIHTPDKLHVIGNRATIKVLDNPPLGNSGIFGVADDFTLTLEEVIMEGPNVFGGDLTHLHQVYGVMPSSSGFAREVVCLECEGRGLTFTVNIPIRVRIYWRGGLIDGLNVWQTQGTCQGILTTDPNGAYGGRIEVDGGARFINLGGQQVGGEHHALYCQVAQSIYVRGAYFGEIFGQGGSLIAPHQGSAPPANIIPVLSIEQAELYGGASIWGMIQSNLYGITKVSDTIIDGILPMTCRGGDFTLQGVTFRNTTGNQGTSCLETYNVTAGPPLINVISCWFDVDNFTHGIWANDDPGVWNLSGANQFFGATNVPAADITISSAATVRNKGSIHRSSAKAVQISAGGKYYSADCHYIGGSDAIYVASGQTAAEVRSRSDEFSTTGGQATGLHYVGTVTAESHKDYYGSNAPTSETPAATGTGQGGPLSKAANYTMSLTDGGVKATAAITVTLPSGATTAEADYSWPIVNAIPTPGGTVTVSAPTGKVINGWAGANNAQTVTITGNGDALVFMPDPDNLTNFIIV